MAEDKDIDTLNAMKDAAFDKVRYTPFQSTDPANALNTPSEKHGPVDTDYTQVLSDIYNTPTTDLIPSFKKPGLMSGGSFGEGTMEQKSDPFAQPLKYTNKEEIEKYIYQDNFKASEFNPFDANNYDRWVAKETWSSSMAKGFDSFGDKFSQTFTDYWKDYGRMVSALAHADALELLPDEKEMLSLNYAEHLSAMENFVFIPEEDEDLIFSKRSMSEFVGNAGFALGTFAALSTELVADALITMATGGGGVGAFAATFTRVGSKLLTKVGQKAGQKAVKEGAEKITKETAKESLKKGNFFTGMLLADEPLDVIKATNNLKRVNHLTKNRTIARDMKKGFSEIFGLNLKATVNAKGFLNKAWEISKGVPLAGNTLKYGEKAIAAAKAGRGFGEVAGIGFKGLRRVAQEYNLAATEAAFEAVSSYGSTLEQMINQHYQETGQEVDPATLQLMKQAAGDASFSNYGTNLAILLATNQIQFGTLFNKMNPSSKFIKEMLEEGGEGVLNVTRRYGTKGTSSAFYDTSKFFGLYGVTGKIAKDFGKKQALFEVGKHFAKGFGRFEVTEGLQENLQEMSNSAWKNYYAGRVNGVHKTLDKAFEEGAAEQFTAQGFRTFLQGALTGSFIRGPVHVTQHFSQKLNEHAVGRAYEGQGQENPFEASKKARLDNIKTFNDFAKHVAENNLDDTAVNFADQMNESMKSTEAAAEAKDYEFVNARDNSMIKAAFAANKLNNIDAFKTVLQDMGQNMTEEQFEEAYKVKLSDTKYNSVAEFADSVERKVTKYSDSLDSTRKRVQDKLVDPFQFEKDSDDFIKATIARKVQEDAIHMIALNEVKSNRADERAKKVFEDYNSMEDLANSSDYVFRVLSTAQGLEGELGNLKADLKVLDESLKTSSLSKEERASLRQEWKDKTKELKLLEEWTTFWGSRDEISTVTDEAGAEKEITNVTLDTFIGVPSKEKQKFKQPDGSFTEEVVFNAQDKRVQQVFKELINLKNKQSGIDTRIYLKNINDGFGKVVDFMQLDQDAKDYMSQAEALYSPESFQATTQRMKDGKYKALLLDYTNSIEYRLEYTIVDILEGQGLVKISKDKNNRPIIFFLGEMEKEKYVEVRNAIIDAVTASDAFNNIVQVIAAKELGIEQTKYVSEQMTALDEVLKEQLKKHLQEFVPEYRFDEVVTDEVWEKFQADNKDVDETMIDAIAKRIGTSSSGTDSLSPREKKIYNAFKGTIDVKAQVIQDKEAAKKKAEEARKGKAYAEMNKEDSLYTVYDKDGAVVKEGLLNTEAVNLVTELNKANTGTDEEQSFAELEYIDKEYTAAISRIQQDVVDESTPVYTTVFYDLDGNPIKLEALNNREALIKKIDDLRAQLITIVKKGSEIEEVSEGPAGDTEQAGDIPTDLQEDEDIEIETGESESMQIISNIKQLESYEKSGMTETPAGVNIAELKKKLINKLNSLEESEQGLEDYADGVSRRRANANSTIERDDSMVDYEAGKANRADAVFTATFIDRNGKEYSLIGQSSEELKTKITELAKFELDINTYGSKKTIELTDEDAGRQATSLDQEGNVVTGTLEKADEEAAQYGMTWLLKVDDNNMMGLTDQEAVIFKEITETTDEAGEIDENISSSTISENANSISEKGEETKEEFPVYNDSGKVVAKYDTEEQALEAQQNINNALANFKWTANHIKDVAIKVNRKGRFKHITVSQLTDLVQQELEKYNATHKKNYNDIESFYNSTITNKKKVDAIVKRYINSNEEIESRPAVEESVEKITTTSKTNQPGSETRKQTQSQIFTEDIKTLHSELQNLNLPSTTTKGTQIGIVFPEGTTDFTKFVDTSAEQIAIDELMKIKPSCKK